MKTTKFVLLIALFAVSFSLKAQDDPDKKPVRSPFSGEEILNTQTTQNLKKNNLSFNIQHRFGTTKNGYSDFFGIFGSSNIRLELRYGIFDKLSVGLGITKENFLHDLNVKYTILQQTRSGSTPISLLYYGDLAADSRSSVDFAKSAYRVSYYNQLVASRKISRLIAVEVFLNHAHFNLADSIAYTGMKNDNLSAGLAAKFRVHGAMSVVAEYDQPILASDIVKPNLAFGIDIGTATHFFEVFISNYHSLSGQYNLAYNVNNISNGDFFIGFNIGKKWSF